MCNRATAATLHIRQSQRQQKWLPDRGSGFLREPDRGREQDHRPQDRAWRHPG